ncbi:MAG: RluA family pseudouridine synthase [Bdellovibrionaceae bacterium]|nr:RluA family pseudouridine synthase [Pseudobdellovibrionaceae bacterium]
MSKKAFPTIEFPEIKGLRLDKALSYFEEVKTRSRAESLLEQERVMINGSLEKNSYKIKGTETILIDFPDIISNNDLVPYDLSLDVLFEDEDLLIVNKPSGLVVHPGAGHTSKTLVNALLAHTSSLSMKFNECRPGIVHRIDKETSGLLVVAKNDLAHEALAQQFKMKTVHRIYQAVLWGRPKETHGTIKSYLARHPTQRKVFASIRSSKGATERDPNSPLKIGKWAVSHYEVLNFNDHLSLVKFQLETGRTHQIRVHSSEMGHPIVGDHAYGSIKKLSHLKNIILKKEISVLPRFLLHARELGLTHPRTKASLMFSVDWPEQDLLFLKKWNLI